MVEHDNRVFWALQGVLLGGLALLAGLTLQREGAMDKLNREVGEIRGLLVAVGSREATFDEKVHRMSEYIQGVPKKNVLSECCWSHSALAQSQVAFTPCV